MGKLLLTEDREHFNNVYTGCMSGVFHALDYQSWHSNVKKILPHRKHGNRRPGGISNDQDSLEISKVSDGERTHIWVDRSTQKATSTHKRSIKACLKALVSEETLKDDHKKRGSCFLSRPMLQRTYSIHHLESDEWVHPIIFFPQNVNSEEFSQKETETPASSEDPDQDETNQINKDLFPSILQDGLKVSPTKAKLIKADSFPSALGSRNLRPTKLKHKLNEFYSVSKNGKRLDTWAPKLDLSKSGSLMVGLDKQGTTCLNGTIDRIDISSRNEHSDFWSVGLTDAGEAKSNGFRGDIYGLSIKEDDHQKTPEITQLDRVLVPECSSQEENQQGFEPLRVSGENTNDKIKSLNNNRCIESIMEHNHNDEYFNYVHEILERSGFVKNGFEQTWYSSNQPLDPSVFQEIEGRYPHDPECFEQELIELSQHLHRFELVNEALLKMHQRSSSYYPKPLSHSCHLSPAPTGKLVLEEVWKIVSLFLDLNPEMDQPMESIVSQDLKVSDGWMNLQLESECIALELEDMIFNKLLEEVFCFKG